MRHCQKLRKICGIAQHNTHNNLRFTVSTTKNIWCIHVFVLSILFALVIDKRAINWRINTKPTNFIPGSVFFLYNGVISDSFVEHLKLIHFCFKWFLSQSICSIDTFVLFKLEILLHFNRFYWDFLHLHLSSKHSELEVRHEFQYSLDSSSISGISSESSKM